tara:strand:- start:1224 stop:2516 length:1293 start_codon:yes stop_codon:yes gene_type:complete
MLYSLSKIFFDFIHELNLNLYTNEGKLKICFKNKVELKIKKISLKIFIICFCIYPYTNARKAFSLSEPIIKVLIAKDTKLRIRADSKIPLIIKNKIFPKKKIKGITIKKQNNKTLISIDKNKNKFYEVSNNISIRSSDKRGIWVNSKRYSGELKILSHDNKIVVINIIGIEKYLNSVVGSEMPHKWPLEALKAQAIASRTYALKTQDNKFYDIDSTQSNQVYNGLESSTYKTRRAVRNTRSLVITHKNKLINALFHSSSGGMTEKSEDVWSNPFPYLITVKDFDQKNPKIKWKKELSKSELKKIFPIIGGIEQIKVLNISETGRIKNLKIYGIYGEKEITGKEFRSKLGLKSTLFRAIIADDFFEKKEGNKPIDTQSYPYLTIKGLGSGHGVGMSQWGARYMAFKGYKAKQILKYFYKGVNIKPYNSIYR